VPFELTPRRDVLATQILARLRFRRLLRLARSRRRHRRHCHVVVVAGVVAVAVVVSGVVAAAALVLHKRHFVRGELFRTPLFELVLQTYNLARHLLATRF
jgi:hypothetical protein